MSFWYCTKHRRVEDEENLCPAIDRLGPYDSREEAARALEIAEERNQAWDEADEDWNEGRVERGDADG